MSLVVAEDFEDLLDLMGIGISLFLVIKAKVDPNGIVCKSDCLAREFLRNDKNTY